MKEIKIKTNNNILKSLNKLSIYNGNICELYAWEYENITTKCYGCYDGEKGFENKHELPPNGISNFLEENSSEKILFNDIFILRFQDDKIINTTISDYGEFYNLIFNEFGDCISDNEESSSSSDEGSNNNLSETEEEFEIISYDSCDDNLENDNNDYENLI